MYKSGGCNCGAVRYKLLNEPLFTHICHCSQCQHSSGGAFNVSTVVLVDDFEFDQCDPDIHFVSGARGNKYEVWSCDECGCIVGGKSIEPAKTMVVRPGTLDDTSDLQPQAHIWISEKQNWVTIPDDVPSFAEGYDAEQLWPQHSLDRLNENQA